MPVKAVVAVAPGVVEVAEVADPQVVEPGDAVVEVERTAICGADLLPLGGHVPGFEWGTVLGHEFVGRVVEAGSDVPYREGVRVVCSSTLSCGRCRQCRRGASSQCESMALFGFSGVYPRLDGGQADRVLVPNAARVLWPLPPDLDVESAVFVADILPTAMRAVERADFHDGATVAITGAGPVGLLALMLTRLRTETVVVVEPDEARHRLARELGGMPVLPDDAEAITRELSGDLGADAVIEASGNESALSLGLRLVGGRSTLSVVGAHFNPAAPVDLGSMFANETTMRFSMGSPTDDRVRAANLILDGRLDPRRIVSDRLALEEAPQAYELFSSRRATKIVMTP